ncbi:probable U3 small nucleolar RNA-associated protein 11 isoform X1 [Malus sylvestris]|uniref:probable U3 small nucleolar RNA-associated protein 11 isoform X1 n=1 Tax=Malus sylvestris TaxID=3752 RepID=UPI0010A9C6F6|nr:probable U3 small nucleolar RNA-associated protein 11 isoform X1 [Malus domestica]XP_050109893.1 probable U3 small nucleolar RNA-associated protein 11 isoform X1 [Malus sylvestris]XP_050109894.1 probable U3 small nucleolar RNA-associated protein 11 isoform X1 [Malus sylvestris]
MPLADGLTRSELNRNRGKNLGFLKSIRTMLSVRKHITKRRRLYGLCLVCLFTQQILKQKAFYRNPDEFNFKMIKTRTVNGVHKLESQANKYTPEELMLMKTQDIGYIFQKVQSEKKKIEKLTATLHSLDNRPSSRHVYFAEDREEAREIQSCSRSGKMPVSEDIPDHIKRKTAGSYRELEARSNRVNELEKIYMDMAMQKELKKKGKKRKLCEDEIVSPTSNPVFKWRAERKR